MLFVLLTFTFTYPRVCWTGGALHKICQPSFSIPLHLSQLKNNLHHSCQWWFSNLRLFHRPSWHANKITREYWLNSRIYIWFTFNIFNMILFTMHWEYDNGVKIQLVIWMITTGTADIIYKKMLIIWTKILNNRSAPSRFTR